MYSWDDDHNNLIPGVVTPALKVFWSRHRAWHHDTVTILVRTELVKNGTKLKLEIYPKDGKTIDTLDKGTISNNQYNATYKIDWKDKKLPDGSKEFFVTATIKDYDLTADSEALVVDLVAPVFSA